MTSLHLYKYSMNKQIEQFKKRNRARNAHLYLDDKIEGTDYIVCPVSQDKDLEELLCLLKTLITKS